MTRYYSVVCCMDPSRDWRVSCSEGIWLDDTYLPVNWHENKDNVLWRLQALLGQPMAIFYVHYTLLWSTINYLFNCPLCQIKETKHYKHTHKVIGTLFLSCVNVSWCIDRGPFYLDLLHFCWITRANKDTIYVLAKDLVR